MTVLQLWFHEASQPEAPGPFVIIAFATVDLAKTKLLLTEQQVLSELIDQLDRMFSGGSKRARQLFVSGTFSSFDKNPYIGGAYRCSRCIDALFES